MQETASNEYPFKVPSTTVISSPEGPVKIVGAEYVGRIVAGLVDNAVRNAPRVEADVKIALAEVKREASRAMWRFEVIDDGPGLPDDLKAEVVQPFETTRQLTRRSPSSLMFYSAILKHLVGCLRIEDRVKGDSSRGTRAVVELPSTLPAEAAQEI